MALQHKIIFFTLLSQSFLCIGMENSDLELIIQDMRTYGADIQKDCITFAQKTNSSFDRLKPAKKQNLCNQTAITIEQPKRFKTSTQQEEEIIDITALFQKEKRTPAKILNNYQPRKILQKTHKKEIVHKLKNNNDQKALQNNPAQRDLEELQKKLHNKHKLESNKDYNDWLEKEEKKLQDSFKNITPSPNNINYASLYHLPYMNDMQANNFFLFKALLSEQKYDHEIYGRAYTESIQQQYKTLQELQKKLRIKHKLESNEDYNDWLEKEGKKLQDSFKNITPSPNNTNYGSLYYQNAMQAKNFFLFKAMLSEQRYDYEIYGRAYAELMQQQYKVLLATLQKIIEQRETPQTPLTANKKIVIEQSQKPSVEKLSDEPDMCENCYMCVAGTTLWAGTAWAISTFLKVLSQVK